MLTLFLGPSLSGWDWCENPGASAALAHTHRVPEYRVLRFSFHALPQFVLLTGPSNRGILAPMTEIVAQSSLTVEEDTFALAVIEFGGNLGAAYRAAYGEGPNPIARARELLTRPEIALRIKALTDAVQEHALISLGSHLVKLAEIRDVSMVAGQFKTALAAEVKRGEAAGFYSDKAPPGGKNGAPQGPSVFVQINNAPANVNEWAGRQGKAPLIVENGQ